MRGRSRVDRMPGIAPSLHCVSDPLFCDLPQNCQASDGLRIIWAMTAPRFKSDISEMMLSEITQ
jgi:hypothetical protein